MKKFKSNVVSGLMVVSMVTFSFGPAITVFADEINSDGSTSSPQATVPPARTFSIFFFDEVVANHDVRIYRDAEGRSILLYGYWNQTTLVIARDPSAFAEILGRLATSRRE